MPAKNPRVNVVLERPMYATLDRLARRDGTSLSSKARDLIRDALELYEDLALAEVAETRDATFDRSAALTHEAVWRRRRRTPRAKSG
jgi:transcriptional antiterminator Rof (Rho-off)